MQCTEPLWDFVAAVSELRPKGAKLSREGEQTPDQSEVRRMWEWSPQYLSSPHLVNDGLTGMYSSAPSCLKCSKIHVSSHTAVGYWKCTERCGFAVAKQPCQLPRNKTIHLCFFVDSFLISLFLFHSSILWVHSSSLPLSHFWTCEDCLFCIPRQADEMCQMAMWRPTIVMTQIWCWPSSALDAFCQARIRQVLHHSSYSFRMFPITLLIWLMIDLIDSHTHIVCLFISLRQSRRLLCGSHNMSSSAGTTSSTTTVAPAVPPSKAPGLQTPAKQQRHHNNNHRSQVIAIAEPLEAKTQNNFPLDTRAKL